MDLAVAERYGVVVETLPEVDVPISSVFAAGDVNADGLGDLVVTFTRPTRDGAATALLLGRSWGGRLHVSSVLDESTLIRLDRCGDQPCEGIQAANVGDLNEDGVDDLVLGVASEEDAVGVQAGAVYVVYGVPGWPRLVDLADVGGKVAGTRLFSSRRSALGFGRTVVGLGDFDGDGTPDLSIGAPREGEGDDALRGAAYVVSGARLSGLSELDVMDPAVSGLGLMIRGPFTGALDPHGELRHLSFGLRLNALGDFDGDGLADLLVGGHTTSPAAYCLILGRRDDPAELDLRDLLTSGETSDRVKVFRLPDVNAHNLAGGFFAGAGSSSGGGRWMLLGVKDDHSLFGPFHRGRVYVFDGHRPLADVTDLNLVPPAGVASTIYARSDRSWFGDELRAAGDLNADGLPDWIIGADHTDGNRGEIHVVFGFEEFPRELDLKVGYAGLRIRGEALGGFLGDGQAIGDFNGDGIGDLAATARCRSGLGSRLYIIYGTGDAAPPLTIHETMPTDGPLRGGTWVRLRGTAFSQEVDVRFGSRSASRVRLLTEGELEALTPPSATPGLVDLRVRKGDEEVVLTGAFEYRENRPDYDLRDLGARGLVLRGQGSGPASSDIAAPTRSPLAFCDLNGDGFDDLAVTTAKERGWQVTLVFGGPDLPEELDALGTTEHQVQVHQPADDTSWSAQVFAVGDLNDDGFDDLGIGLMDGRGYLVFGREEIGAERTLDLGAERDAGRAAWFQLFEDPAPSLSHLAMAPLGDVTGDGIGDFAMGHPRGAGELVLVAGRRDWPAEQWGLDDQFVARVYGDLEDRRLAVEVELLGDVDGDGLGDLLLASDAIDSVGGRSGVAYLVRGGIENLRGDMEIGELIAEGGAHALWIVEGFEHVSWFSIAAPGDVNGDGLADLLIGVEGGGELTAQGVTYLLYGRSQFPPEMELALESGITDGVVRLLGEGLQEYAGRVGPAGDYNADGFADFLIGGPGFQDTEPGNVHLVYGGPALPSRINLKSLGGSGVKFTGANSPGGAGAAVGPWGDVNGDGQSDFVFSEGVTTERSGVAHVYAIYGPYAQKEFVRGDANRDGRLDLSDAMFILQFLFSGGEGARCEDAADVDDRGQVDLTDAVRLLSYLFADGVAPEAPHPDAGLDPTPDELGCLGF